jgi:hypothetical protein
MYRPIITDTQNPISGATIHHTAISPITARFSSPVASASPAIAPTAVIDVEAGTPT